MVVNQAQAEKELEAYIAKRKEQERMARIKAQTAKMQQERYERNYAAEQAKQQRKEKMRKTAQNIYGFMQRSAQGLGSTMSQFTPPKSKKSHNPRTEPSIFGDLDFSMGKGSDLFSSTLFGTTPKKRTKRRKRREKWLDL